MMGKKKKTSRKEKKKSGEEARKTEGKASNRSMVQCGQWVLQTHKVLKICGGAAVLYTRSAVPCTTWAKEGITIR